MNKPIIPEFGWYDVYCGWDGIIQVLAMSEIDAMQIVETKGYTPLDCDKSIEIPCN